MYVALPELCAGEGAVVAAQDGNGGGGAFGLLVSRDGVHGLHGEVDLGGLGPIRRGVLAPQDENLLEPC